MSAWWATLLVGLAVLLLGRRLFWLFVGAAGFAAGLQWARAVLDPQPEWLALAVALVVGLVGALLAFLFQWVAIGVGGFLAGTYVGLSALGRLGLEGAWLWVGTVVAGVLAAALLIALWDWVLIVLSAVTGAVLLTSLVTASPTVTTLVFVGLLAVGLLVQTRAGAAPAPARPARTRRA